MKQVVIGIAGHVDHGKTCLVKALTGMDTDRLAEEKARGLTTDLGFAWLELAGGIQAGVVDLPGHRKFLRNMLAGAGGVDLAVLVVAADEGVMPQTREHLAILQLLGVTRGLVALTKTDLAQPEERALALEELAALTKGTFLEDAPVLPLCAPAGEGVAALAQALAQLAGQVPPHPVNAPFLLPVDRAFLRPGFGPVATGPVVAGVLEPGAELELQPAGLGVRVRGLQAYGRPVDRVSAGQRAAVNLSGVPLEALGRGAVLAQPGGCGATRLLDVQLELLPGCGRALSGGERLHLSCGAVTLVCRAALLGRPRLEPGETGYAQLRLDRPVAAWAGQRFVVQWFSPVALAGGGVVLDPCPSRHRPSDRRALAALEGLAAGSPLRRLEAALSRAPFLWVGELPPGQAQVVPALAAQGGAQLFSGGVLLSPWSRARLEAALERQLEGYHRAHPLLPGMPEAQLLAAWAPALPTPARRELVEGLCQAGRLRRAGERLALAAFSPRWDARRLRIRRELEARYRQGGLQPPALPALEAAYAQERAPFAQVVEALLEEGALARGDGELLFWAGAEQAALARMRAAFPPGSPFTLAQCRDRLGTTRRYALALLERWDRQGLTRRQGESRRFL